MSRKTIYPDVVKEYSEISDIDELVRKLADMCKNIAHRNF